MVKLNVRRLLHGGGQFMGFVAGTLYAPSLHAEQSTLASLRTRLAAGRGSPRELVGHLLRATLTIFSTRLGVARPG